MKKRFYLIIIVIIFSKCYKIYAYSDLENHLNLYFIQNTISIKDLMVFKNYSNEQIHDYLILNNWVFVSNEKARKGGSIIPYEEQIVLYKHNSSDLTISIIKKNFFKDNKRLEIYKTDKYIEVSTESSNEYKIILNDLYKNNYKINGEEKEYGSLEMLTTSSKDIVNKMESDYVNTKISEKAYKSENNIVILRTEVFEKYDKNMNLLRRLKYTLQINSSINSNISLSDASKDLSSCLNYNKDLVKINQKLKEENQQLITSIKSATIIMSKGAENLEKSLESLKEKDLRIRRMQDLMTKKDSVTLELIKTLKAQKK